MSEHRVPGRSALAGALAAALVLGGAWLGGCTSDDPGLVGTDIPSAVVLGDPQVMRFDAVSEWGSVGVADPDYPLPLSEVLYVGEKNGYASTILATYDIPSALPDTLPIEPNSVETVSLRLFLTKVYGDSLSTLNVRLSAMADTVVAADYPGTPPMPGRQVGAESGVANVVGVELTDRSWLYDAWQAEEPATLGISLVDLEEETIVPYAASELELYTELARTIAGTIVGPTITVTFKTEVGIDPITFAPRTDISTFTGFPTQDTGQNEEFFLRTHLREYPWLRLDLSDLPAGVVVNRAVLRMRMDLDASFGPPQSLVLSRLPHDLVAETDSLDFDAMEDELEFVAGWTTVAPETTSDPELGFDITDLVQRVVNGVLDESVTLMLTAGEDQFPAYDTTLHDPEFYLTHMTFLGPDAEDAPSLEITYTEFSGGAQ